MDMPIPHLVHFVVFLVDLFGTDVQKRTARLYARNWPISVVVTVCIKNIIYVGVGGTKSVVCGMFVLAIAVLVKDNGVAAGTTVVNGQWYFSDGVLSGSFYRSFSFFILIWGQSWVGRVNLDGHFLGTISIATVEECLGDPPPTCGVDAGYVYDEHPPIPEERDQEFLAFRPLVRFSSIRAPRFTHGEFSIRMGKYTARGVRGGRKCASAWICAYRMGSFYAR